MTPGPLPRRGLRLTSVFVVVVAVGLALGWLLGGDAVAVAEIGQPAPDFSVEVIDGGTFTLSEARGQPVIVNFWASWCGPCRTEIPDISAFAEANPDVTIVGVAVQDAEQTAREFAAEIDASYPLALGTTAVEDAYPNLGLPATYVVDENGIVTEIINGIVDEESLASA
ncbi:MAG TPA: TlpA disulfide reductase family protein, partial [Acidimicrobiia bacterium]|nr:TlpA disulfide reductase family protein [Acidimicrobiia bacterium]